MSALNVAPTVPSSSEQELVAAVRRGDERAFEELYSRYRRRIAAYILGLVGDHARAEDIAQEVFISALRRLRATERPIAFKPWIYEIAKNASIDEFRRTKRAREVPLAAASAVGSSAGAEEDGADRDLPSTAPTPDVAVESKQSLSDLRGAFHGLSENHHKVLVMRELEGLSYSQIGERLGMTRPVVESTLFRARKRLSEEYDELVSGRRCQHVQSLIDSSEERTLTKLGIRERRQLGRHLAHCQPCRRHARMAGLDESLFQAPTLVGKIAALLPFPWLLRRRSGARQDTAAVAGSSSHTLNTLQTVAQLVDPTSFSGAGRAAAAIAALAFAGVGGGVVTAVASHSSRPASPRAASIAPAGRAAARAQQPHAGASKSSSAAGAAHQFASVRSTVTGIGRHGSRSAPTRARPVSAPLAPRSAAGAGSGAGTGSGAPTHSGSVPGTSNPLGSVPVTTPSGVPSAPTTVTHAIKALLPKSGSANAPSAVDPGQVASTISKTVSAVAGAAQSTVSGASSATAPASSAIQGALGH